MQTQQPAAPSADLWTPQQAAHALGVSARTLATWRSTGRHNLPFVKVGRLVRYRLQDVADWLQSRRKQTALPHELASQPGGQVVTLAVTTRAGVCPEQAGGCLGSPENEA